MPPSQTTAELLAILEWYQALGVDAALEDIPVDWLSRGLQPPGDGFTWPDRASHEGDNPAHAERAGAALAGQGASHSGASAVPSRPPSAPSLPPAAARPRAQTPLAASEAETEARRKANGAASLEALGQALSTFEGCALKATATNLCFYRGAPRARVMLIGEAPGRDEDIAGQPFVGRAGQLLDKMLAAIGLTEADVHITNVVYWRPPGNRTPTPQETLACRPFLERQMELVEPEMIIALGGAAAKEVLNVADGIMRLRGKWRTLTVAGQPRAALATLHPAYLLRTPAAKQLAWLDLLSIKARLTQR